MHHVPRAFANRRRSEPLVGAGHPDSALARLLKTKRAVELPEITIEKAYLEGICHLYATAELAKARSLLAVPLLKDNEVIGAIAIYRKEMRAFAASQIELVTDFAVQAVIAIENVRLFEAEQQRTRELRDSLQQQTATADVLEIISRSAFDLQPVFETLVESSVRLCGADKAFIFRFDGELLRGRRPSTPRPSLRSSWREIPSDPGGTSGSARAAWNTGPSTFTTCSPIRNIYTERKASMRSGPCSAYPYFKGDTLLGVFMIYGWKCGLSPPTRLQLVETFADQAAIAIENVRLFEAEQQRTRDLSEALQQQTATADVLKVISRSAFDLQTVLNTLVESACAAVRGR